MWYGTLKGLIKNMYHRVKAWWNSDTEESMEMDLRMVLWRINDKE